MKKVILPLVKKAGERAAQVPVNVRSWPSFISQSKIPESLRIKMAEQDKR